MKKLLFFISSVFFLTGAWAQVGNTPAEFPGGDSAWNIYMDTAFDYHAMAAQMTQKDFERFGKVQKVQYSFFIMADGSIGIINIQGGVSQVVRNEIYRVLQQSPKWTPATVNGIPSTYRKKQVSTFRFD